MELETKEFIGMFRGKKVNIIEDNEELTISRSLFQYMEQLEESNKQLIEKDLNNLFQEINLRRILYGLQRN